MPIDKNPAAVALGKRRQAKMTDAERAAFAQARDEARRKRTPEERRRIARKAAMTKRRGPKWIAQKKAPAEMPAPRVDNGVPEIIHLQDLKSEQQAKTGPPGDLAQLERAIDELPDELLESLARALFARPA